MMDILIYKDKGVSARAFKEAFGCLSESFDTSEFKVKRVNARALIRDEWEKNTFLLVIPGGRSTPYHESLNGEGNQKIRRFVEHGGNYLGLCAGAYYASKIVEFEKGQPLEVLREHELGFFPGVSMGPAYGLNTYDYESEKGARASKIEWAEVPGSKERRDCMVYFNGGCTFLDCESFPSVTTLAKYADLEGKPPAIIECKVGKGTAVLSGPHPEYRPESLDIVDPYIKEFHGKLSQSSEDRVRLMKRIFSRFTAP